MPQLTLPFGLQNLLLEFENDSLQLKLCPVTPSSDPCYTYTTKLQSQNMDDRLSFVFGSIPNLWKYLSFYKERAILIDFPRVEMENKLLIKDYPRNSHQNPDKRQVELPISFKLIVLEGIETILGLKGEMIVDSVEKRLAKALKENEDLKQKLSASQTLQSQLQETISEMKKTIDFLESERQRLLQQQLPKKKIHISEEREEGEQIVIEHTNKDNLSQNDKYGLEQFSFNAHFNQNLKRNVQIGPSKVDQISLTPQNAEECKVNEQPVEHHPMQNENLPTMKSTQVEQRVDFAPTEKNAINSSKQFNNDENFDRPEGNQYEVVQKLAEFAKKCFLLVGFTDKGEERSGFVCIACSKAFKDVSYLEKHLLLRHPEMSTSTEEMLAIRLNQYKKKKENEMKLENALKYYAAPK